MRVPMWAMVALCAVQPALAQLQLSALDGLAGKAKESAEILLDSATLQLANGFLGKAKAKDGKATELLSKLKAIQVRTYEFSKAGQYDPGVVRQIQEQLRGQGWTKFVDVNDNEDGETFTLFSRTQNGRNTGFAMVAAEAKELAVIYIDGEVSLADLAGLGGQFGIPKLPIPAADAGKNDAAKNKDKSKNKGKE